ncbi:MAG TPA: hypothetical protein VF020_24375 [Chthoniobacterales bacterium]
MTNAAAKQVTSGNLMATLIDVPDALQARLHLAGFAAFANGFAAAALFAALMAAIACGLTFELVPRTNPTPVESFADGPVRP